MRRLWVLAATMLLCVGIALLANYSKQQPTSNAVESPATAATPLPRQPTRFGVNLYTPAYWSKERAFMNLAAAGAWRSIRGSWADFDTKRIDRNGTILSLAPGEQAALALTRPPRAYREDVPIRCRFQGKGKVGGVSVVSPVATPGQLDFTWRRDIETTHFLIEETDPTDPIRHIDCREADADPKLVFDPAFIEFIRPFKALRFLDWQATNANVAGKWAQRTLPTNVIQGGQQGVAVEYLVMLANQAKLDPWFVMPWNADADYMEKFARYVRENLDPARTIYVEIGNEMWNPGFPAARQAIDEGLRAKLSADKNEARMRRYAQHSVEGFKVWEKVFADKPDRIVRVLGGQNEWPDLFLMAIDYADTASHVDAVSSALYFGHDVLERPPVNTTDLTPIFAAVDTSMDRAFGFARKFKGFADARGLRYIGYEGGQHLKYQGPDATLIARLNRDPRMGDAYRRYMTKWDREFGDLLMLYASVAPMNSGIHFGLAEYSGQPLSEAPKQRAVLEALSGR